MKKCTYIRKSFFFSKKKFFTRGSNMWEIGCHEIFLNSMNIFKFWIIVIFFINISYLNYNNKQCDENIILKISIYHHNLIFSLNIIITSFLLFYFVFVAEEWLSLFSFYFKNVLYLIDLISFSIVQGASQEI